MFCPPPFYTCISNLPLFTAEKPVGDPIDAKFLLYAPFLADSFTRSVAVLLGKNLLRILFTG